VLTFTSPYAAGKRVRHEPRAAALARAPSLFPQERAGKHSSSCACGGGCPRCKASQAETGAPPIVREVLQSSGEPLAQAAAGADARLSHVRIHADPLSRASAAAVGAQAYTVGEHVVLGAHAPALGSGAGQALLRHELGHTLQQPRIGRTPPADIPIGASDAHEERDAGRDAPSARDARPVLRRLTIRRSCFNSTGHCAPGSSDETDSQEAFDRVGQTAAGQWLQEQLERIPSLRDGTIEAYFGLNVARDGQDLGAFRPGAAHASEYTVFVDLNLHSARGTASPAAADAPLPEAVSTEGGFFQGENRTVPSYVVERSSLLAETLFHEMLHIWFINTIGTRGMFAPGHPEFGDNISDATGHLDEARGEIDTRFLRRLREFAVGVYRIESDPERLRRVAAAHAPTETPRPSAPIDATPRTSTPPVSSEPAPVTFTAGVRVGLGEAPAVGNPFDVPLEVHAGMLLGRAYQFGLRGEAVWLPRVGLVGLGGSLAFNALQTEDAPGGGSRVATNPWFFDLEAGAAYLIDVPDPLLLRAGAGVGIEVGAPDAWRPFFRVGAALELNPTPGMWNIGGAGNFTVGVRR
jgi:Domain of unknown function (DUF4157)